LKQKYDRLNTEYRRQNKKMRDRLASLGFAMAVEPVPNYTQLTDGAFNNIKDIADAYSAEDRRYQKSSSSHTAGRSLHTSGNGAVVHPFPSSDRPLKRQRVDSPLPRDMYIDQPSSRDVMPPPSKPMSRMRSMRGFIPTLRKKFSNGRTTPVLKGRSTESRDVQMYDHGHRRDPPNVQVDIYEPSPCRNMRSETPYMTGALPIEPASQASHLLTSLGVHGDASDYSFRASSPIKMNRGHIEHRPVQLPTGPSYLHLMDGLSRDNGLELGLKDPRENAAKRYKADNTFMSSMDDSQIRRQTQELNIQKRWGSNHAFLHPSPTGLSRLADHHQCTLPLETSNGHFTRANYGPSLCVTTPDPSRFRQPGQQIENVVSPFFGRRHHDAPNPSKPRFTETQTSLSRFGASQSPRYPNLQIANKWREPCSLNGLSFIKTPLHSRNEPVTYDGQNQSTGRLPSRNYQPYNSDSRSYIMRPDTHRYPFADDSGYRSSVNRRLTFSRQQEAQPQSAISFPSFDHASSSRLRQLPSTMTSMVSSRPCVRSRTQWDTLQCTGVRSSRQTHDKIRGIMPNTSLADSLSRVERRNVRR
jgi:hypothetical protein